MESLIRVSRPSSQIYSGCDRSMESLIRVPPPSSQIDNPNFNPMEESLIRVPTPYAQIKNPNLTHMEEEIQIIVDVFVTCSSTLCFTTRVKPSKNIYSLKRIVGLRLFKYQGPDSRAVYDVFVFHAVFFGGQLLEDGLTLTECNISDMDRVSVFPWRPFLVNVALSEDPESGPVRSSIQVINGFESVGSLKRKLFDWKRIPLNKQLVCCGERWLLPTDDKIRLMDLGIIQQFGSDHKLLDMPVVHMIGYRRVRFSDQKFEISVKVPQDGLQFRLTVCPTDTVSHLKAIILEKYYFCDETHMLVFGDKNLLEDGYSALVDHDIEKKAELVLCQKGSFVIGVTKRGSDQHFTIEVESSDTVDVLKAKIQKMTDIAPDNQILFQERDEGREVMYKGCLGRYGIVKLSSPEMPEVLISHSDDDNRRKFYPSQKYMDNQKQISVPKIPLAFWKRFSDSAAAGVPLEEFLLQVNSEMNLEASFKIYVLVRLNVCLIFRMMLTVGLGDTLESLKTRIKELAKSYKEIDDLGYIQQGAYVFLHKKHKLQDDGLLTMEQCGISNESEIIICPNASFTVEVCFWSSVHVKDIQKSVTVNCLDTVESVKKKMIADLGCDAAMQLYYNEAPLSGEKYLVDYGIVSHPVASVKRRWKACEIKLKVIMDEKRRSLCDERGGGLPELNPKKMRLETGDASETRRPLAPIN